MDNLSDSEEEILIFAQFEEGVNIEKYRNIHVLGVNDENPLFQMDDTFFIGKYENPLGTYMFFEEDPAPHSSDPLFDKLPENNLKYLFKTRKCIKMNHAYVTPKENSDYKVKVEQEDEIQPIEFKSVQEAVDTFKDNWETIKDPQSVKEEENLAAVKLAETQN